MLQKHPLLSDTVNKHTTVYFMLLYLRICHKNQCKINNKLQII